MTFAAEALRNEDADDENEGWATGVSSGALRSPGDWRLYYQYASFFQGLVRPKRGLMERISGWRMRSGNYRLPLEIKELFEEWLDAHAPDRRKHVLALLRQRRGGDLYRSNFGERMRGRGPLADLLERRFQLACRRLGLDADPPGLGTSAFIPPAPDDRQMSLL